MIAALSILAPVDFSQASVSSVDYATALAQTLRSTVTLLHVYQEADLMSTIVPGADRAADDREDRALAERWLDELCATLEKARRVEVRVLLVHGGAAPEIIRVANGGFALVVMGTHGRTGLRHVLMGSVAEAVVRGASCPVLTVHLPTIGLRSQTRKPDGP